VGFQEDLIHGSHGANLSSPVLNFENAGHAGYHKHSQCVGKGINLERDCCLVILP
jgi:hypothetical protein